MMKMTNKVLASSLVILAALGLAGCTNSAAAPTKTSTSATKVSQQTSKRRPPPLVAKRQRSKPLHLLVYSPLLQQIQAQQAQTQR